MNRAWMMAAGLAVMFAGGAARAAGPVEDEITGLENKWTQAVADRDRATMEQVIAPDWSGQDDKATASTREQAITRALKGKDHYTSAKNRDIRVMVAGDVAVAQGFEDDHLIRAGRPVHESISFTDVFQKRDGRWVAVRSQFTPLKAKKAKKAA